jgi:hypothetical protein
MKLRLSLALLAPVTWMAAAAPASAVVSATTTTTSSDTVYAITDISVIDQVDTYSTELIANIQGGPTLVSDTLGVSASSPSFLSAVSAAEATLTGAGATSFAGPTLTSSAEKLIGTTVQDSTLITGSSLSIVSTVYIGPQTIYIGMNQAYPFVIPPGSEDINTLVTTNVAETVTKTTTNTDLLTQVYDLTGATGKGITTAPELDAASAAAGWTLLIGGIAVLRGRRRREGLAQ